MNTQDRFVPLDPAVFYPGTYGALGICWCCKERTATLMTIQGRRWRPYCEKCKERATRKIEECLKRDNNRPDL